MDCEDLSFSEISTWVVSCRIFRMDAWRFFLIVKRNEPYFLPRCICKPTFLEQILFLARELPPQKNSSFLFPQTSTVPPPRHFIDPPRRPPLLAAYTLPGRRLRLSSPRDFAPVSLTARRDSSAFIWEVVSVCALRSPH